MSLCLSMISFLKLLIEYELVIKQFKFHLIKNKLLFFEIIFEKEVKSSYFAEDFIKL